MPPTVPSEKPTLDGLDRHIKLLDSEFSSMRISDEDLNEAKRRIERLLEEEAIRDVSADVDDLWKFIRESRGR